MTEQLGEQYGAIFSAHLQMLRDHTLSNPKLRDNVHVKAKHVLDRQQLQLGYDHEEPEEARVMRNRTRALRRQIRKTS